MLSTRNNNRLGRQIKLTYNQALFLITNPRHNDRKRACQGWKVDYFIYIQEDRELWQIALFSQGQIKRWHIYKICFLIDYDYYLVIPKKSIHPSTIPDSTYYWPWQERLPLLPNHMYWINNAMLMHPMSPCQKKKKFKRHPWLNIHH